MTDRLGQRLGNYRLLRRLGRGGFAEVYLGEHLFLKTQAAIKVLQMRLTNEDLESFLNEARIIASMVHPHIVRVLEFGVEGSESILESDEIDVEGSTPYLVMDYAPNGTLRKRHPKGSRLPLATIVSYVKQVAEALQYAHQQKLIHRDIKPENMLVGRNNEVLISDFGIALVAQSSRYEHMQEAIGTLAYMAPEQIQGKPRIASDQYALAIVVYEWLSGDRPFSGSFTELATQHMFAPPPPLHEKIPVISPAVEEVVMTALAKDPHQRFASVQAFANALEQANRLEPPRPTVTLHDASSYELLTTSSPTLPASRPIDTPITPLSLSASENALSTQPPLLYIPSTPNTLSSSQLAENPKRLVSRRLIVTSLAGLALAGAAGGIIWLSSSPKPLVLHHPNLPLGTTLYIYRGHSSYVLAVAWSPDGKRIVSSSGDVIGTNRGDTTVRIWDATTGGHVLSYRHHSLAVPSVAWSPDGKYIASAADDATVQVWNASTGISLYSFTGQGGWNSAAWSPDSKRIASANGNKIVQIWDALTGKNVLTYRGHSNVVSSAEWSPDGKHIASASWDKTVQVWDALTGNNVLTYRGHLDPIASAGWSPDGKHLTSGDYGPHHTVQVWEFATGNTIFTYHGHSDFLLATAWSPDGIRIASAGRDKTVQIWDATTGRNAFIYKGHTDRVRSVAWSPDGILIASGSKDTTVRVWQAR